MKQGKTILVAPLNWGLGHATRCIPIIDALLAENFKVIIASDGASLLLLQKEFPCVETLELPSYSISYSKKKIWFKLHLLLKIPKIKKALNREKDIINKWVSEKKIDGIISDNRFGVYHSKIPSVFISHQIQVLSGNTTKISTGIHQKLIKNFDECWVPDQEGKPNLTGKLGHIKNSELKLKYIGVLSRMKKQQIGNKYDFLILLSGPEPQRTLLETKLIEEFKASSKKILLVRGLIEKNKTKYCLNNIIIVNYLKKEALEKAINQSSCVIARSGYTTIMDLSVLEKKVFFIPTPGQYEQEYLAKRLTKKKIVPSCKEEDFTIEHLQEIPLFKGLKNNYTEPNFTKLFSLFKGK